MRTTITTSAIISLLVTWASLIQASALLFPRAPACIPPPSCLVNPAIATDHFVLLDLATGLPIVKVGREARLATQAFNITKNYFQFNKASGAPTGLYDLVYTVNGVKSYLGISETGRVVFESASSKGQNYVPSKTVKNETYITSVWSAQCDGTLSPLILGSPPLEFVLDGNSLVVIVPSSNGGLSKRAGVELPEFMGVLHVLEFLHEADEWLHTPGPEPRCASEDAIAIESPWARPIGTNGCGPDRLKTLFAKYSINTDFFDFNVKPCCDQHDECYDTCSTTWEGCNQAFFSCMVNKCDADYEPGSLRRFACENLATVYHSLVASPKGREAFEEATNERCMCTPHCKDSKKKPCFAGCKDLNTDPENCGECSNVCRSGKCVNGDCVKTDEDYTWSLATHDGLYEEDSKTTEDIFRQENGKETINTNCVPVSQFGHQNLMDDKSTIPKGTMMSFVARPERFFEACCLQYFSNDKCDEKNSLEHGGYCGTFTTTLGMPVRSFLVYNCQGGTPPKSEPPSSDSPPSTPAPEPEPAPGEDQADLDPWVFRVVSSTSGDKYEENPYDLSDKSSGYLIDSPEGIATFNTVCATFFNTGLTSADTQVSQKGQMDGLAAGDQVYFGYDDGDVEHDSCCLEIFADEECSGTGDAAYKKFCGAGTFKLPFFTASWHVSGCKAQWGD